MATPEDPKTTESKPAGLASNSVTAGAEMSPTQYSPTISTEVLEPATATRPVAIAPARSAANTASPVTAVAAKGAPIAPRFTSEETILLRGLASGATSKEMAAQMRLPRESLYRLIGDLRRKTGTTSDTALAVWVLRNMRSGGSERRGGGR